MEDYSGGESEVNCSTPPPELLEDTTEDTQDVADSDRNLTESSKLKYNFRYEHFISWTMDKQISSISESVLLSYFGELAEKYKPSSLWAIYSMLKSTLLSRSNIDIKEYTKLTAFLRRESKGFKSKKTRVFSATDVHNFLKNAPDDKYLLVKVVLILGVNGACRSQELIDITIDNFDIHEDMMLIRVPDIKTKLQRSFVITDMSYDIVAKYKNLRPKDMPSKRFLLLYRDKKCIKQVIGKNYVNTMPKIIATFLNLQNPKEYTGHCFRKTSARLLACSGADLATIQQQGGWKSKVVRSYIENSTEPEAPHLPFLLVSKPVLFPDVLPAPAALPPPPPAARSATPPPPSPADCPSPPSPAPVIDSSREDVFPLWRQEMERQRVEAAEQDAETAERLAAATERASERQTAAIEMLAVRLAASAEQQAAALASINRQLSDIRNILTSQ